MEIVAVVAILALTGLLLWREWLHAQERKDAQEERAQLLDRIQAPEIVIQRRAAQESVLPDYEPIGDPWEPPPPVEDDD